MAEGTARIAGTVMIDGEPAARDVVVISDNKGGRQVVGEGRSASDGTFDITYSDWTGPVIALALDNYGQAWAAGANLNNGTVVHPTEPNGYVYHVTSAGTTGTEEPTWSTEGSVTDGSVTYEAKPYYRPVASGPLEGEVEVPVLPVHRYWRIYIYDGGSDKQIDLREIELMTEPGGPSVAIAATAFANYEDTAGGRGASNAFDGDTNTRWSTPWGKGYTSDVYIGTDLGEGSEAEIVQVVVHCNANSNAPTDFALEWSDNGTEWVEAGRWQTTWIFNNSAQTFDVQ